MGFVFFFKQKTAYEIKECDWSSDVCSSDLALIGTKVVFDIHKTAVKYLKPVTYRVQNQGQTLDRKSVV